MKFNKKEQKKEEKNQFQFLKGMKNEKDNFSPSYMNITNPRYIEIDECYFSGLLVVNYYREYDELILKNLIDTNINMSISIFYEKQDTYKTIRDLTYHIGNTSVDLENKGKNDQEIDLVAFSYNDARYIRREMQVNNQSLYFLYIYLLIASKEKSELGYLLNKIEGICSATRHANKKGEF